MPKHNFANHLREETRIALAKAAIIHYFRFDRTCKDGRNCPWDNDFLDAQAKLLAEDECDSRAHDATCASYNFYRALCVALES